MLFFGNCEETVTKSGCENVHCDFGAICAIGEGNHPECVCSFDCRDDSDAFTVCGSDLFVYSSYCRMKDEACKSRKVLELLPMHICEGT